jgi:hypothetical protein
VSLEEDFLAMTFLPVINYDARLPSNLKYGLEMLVAHCVATGKNTISHDFVLEFLNDTPYASYADRFKPEHLHRAIDDQQ